MGLNINGGGKSLPPPKGEGTNKGVNTNLNNILHYKRGGSPSHNGEGEGGDPSTKGGVKVKGGIPSKNEGMNGVKHKNA
jgi:hypothetical protein